MKINQPVNISPTSTSIGASKGKSAQLNSSEVSKKPGKPGLKLSNSANFIQSLKDATADFTSIRQEMVDEAKADIESGRLGTDADYDQTITALLMEL